MIPAEYAPAIEALEGCLAFSRPADARLSAFFRAYPKLGARDRAMVAETVYGVLRQYRVLEVLSERPTPRRLVFAWLARYGGHNLRQFELRLEGKGKEHDLEWIKRVKAANLDDLPPAVRLNLPDWLYDRLNAQYGDSLSDLMAALNRSAPLDLRANPQKMEREAVLSALAAEGVEAVPTPYSPLGLRLAGKPGLQKHPLFLEGAVEVQDEGSQLLGLLLGPKRGEMVCDFCAGAGGKTLLLGALMKNTGRLYAFDVAEKRLANLKPRLARSGLSNVHPQLITDERDQKLKRLVGKFDRVLVDAPCSGLGTLRRNPDLKWRQTEASVAELTVKQAAILASAARLVKPAGRLVYAACSLLAEENEDIVSAFLAAHPDYRLVPVGEVLAERKVALEMGDNLRLRPDRHDTDGFFAAVLERAG
jgi:16S rRNA (cytosine967-C5)-methyltransferase